MLEWLENTQFSAWVRTELWGWPLALTLHAFGTALVVGFILIIGLRLLGLFKLIPYTLAQSAVSRPLGCARAAIRQRLLLWMTKPTQYVADGAFVLKFALVDRRHFLTLSFYRTIKREAGAWETKERRLFARR